MTPRVLCFCPGKGVFTLLNVGCKLNAYEAVSYHAGNFYDPATLSSIQESPPIYR